MPSVDPSPANHSHPKRQSSQDSDDNVLIFPLDEPAPPPLPLGVPPRSKRNDTKLLNGDGPQPSTLLPANGSPPKTNGVEHGGWGMRSQNTQRSRVTSVPAVPSPLSDKFPSSHSHSHAPNPPSAGPYRTSFAVPRSPSTNGFLPHGRHQAPAMRQSLSLPAHSSTHSRARSVSGPFSPSSPSPLSTSFPIPQSVSYPPSSVGSSPGGYPVPPPPLEPSTSPTRTISLNNGLPLPSTQSSSRRHSRLHSRNLSVFFPRPGSLPTSAIDEDAGQEIEFSPAVTINPPDGEGILMPAPSPGPGQRTFKQGFTFGARPPGASSPTPDSAESSGASRRGHHHKHSMSHNFFSFLEPGGELHTQPTLTPTSPWSSTATFGFPDSESNGLATERANGVGLHARERSPERPPPPVPRIEPIAVLGAAWQFILGATLWVTGQQIGSLSCTGLGYWVVFDSFGVSLARVLPGYLARPESQPGMKRPYGNARIETLMSYAQSVYLLFASVYVCKETVEHLLLSSGEEAADGHHHHHGHEDVFGIEFPPLLLCITLLSLIGSAVMFNNHSKLVSATGNYIPPLPSLLPFRLRYSISRYYYPPLIENLFTNPYSLAPIAFCASIICGYALIPPNQHLPFDLLLAAVETFVTFTLAYPAAVALGSVLLQTAPARGLPGGRMEAFLRAMREIERHPQVLHLPAPHFWQLTPHFTRPEYIRSPAVWDGPAQSLVVTIELHVARDLEDEDVLKLTAWAGDRCRTALRYGSRDGGGEGEADVTVGVTRG